MCVSESGAMKSLWIILSVTVAGVISSENSGKRQAKARHVRLRSPGGGTGTPALNTRFLGLSLPPKGSRTPREASWGEPRVHLGCHSCVCAEGVGGKVTQGEGKVSSVSHGEGRTLGSLTLPTPLPCLP